MRLINALLHASSVGTIIAGLYGIIGLVVFVHMVFTKRAGFFGRSFGLIIYTLPWSSIVEKIGVRIPAYTHSLSAYILYFIPLLLNTVTIFLALWGLQIIITRLVHLGM